MGNGHVKSLVSGTNGSMGNVTAFKTASEVIADEMKAMGTMSYERAASILQIYYFCSMVLSQEEIDGCREAFLAFDKDRSGTIDVWELRQVLEAMGQHPTEEELFQMISEVDENMSGSIDFAEFLKVIENQKERAENFDDESDMIDAFVACGGLQDKSGNVKRETLVKIIKHDFGLTIDIEELINKIDTDGSGEIEFEEFKTLLS